MPVSGALPAPIKARARVRVREEALSGLWILNPANLWHCSVVLVRLSALIRHADRNSWPKWARIRFRCTKSLHRWGTKLMAQEPLVLQLIMVLQKCHKYITIWLDMYITKSGGVHNGYQVLYFHAWAHLFASSLLCWFPYDTLLYFHMYSSHNPQHNILNNHTHTSFGPYITFPTNYRQRSSKFGVDQNSRNFIVD